ncbi:amphi-Trp domain-containing protein [Nocardioides daphniae]|uniref:Amphi-Trp domain-containing protein n=1 Tax=Nocardioides daphniae TaxID=402297 RepID=A0A4P7UDZ7_9ACTN|nr:amphi-Trp domain-containing protein [Nocardioides daphniae]QCC78500.1 amphi-Trp domain-containing protein [Nocardioides daphniae]GGD11915.1 hypothetical protein GCM10007231_08500 [Nocardioides daphniae]
MDLFEIDEKQRMSREAAADKLRALADSLSRHNSVEFQKAGKTLTVSVPDQVELAIEVELGDDNELEIELSW